MIARPIEGPGPTLDARWIIGLWVAIHGMRAAAETGGETVLDPAQARAAAGNAILALTSQLDAETAHMIAAALDKGAGAPDGLSDAQVEDSLKRFGIRLSETGALSVAGFGRICWE